MIIDNVVSESKYMTLGVPQGTVLSPLLYIIYVKGLSYLQIEGSLYFYADDTAFIVTGDSRDTVIHIAENSLEKIVQ